jgi:hypothetical protein
VRNTGVEPDFVLRSSGTGCPQTVNG